MPERALRDRFTAISDAWALAQGIVDTVREPVLVLDKDLRVITASRSFYSGFKVSPSDTQGQAALCVGRRTMGHSTTSRVARKNHS